jgi:hypothetical protein
MEIDMAHFRRNRPRHRTSPGGGRRSAHWLHCWPAWWDRLFHSRPARRRAKALTYKVLRGEIDADNAAWDVHRTRPHKYYW